MALTPAEKKEIINKFGASASDTGSPEAQVALLSKRIEQVTEHLQTNKHDHHNRRGLLAEFCSTLQRQILRVTARSSTSSASAASLKN
jgi:ribosomal protein S15